MTSFSPVVLAPVSRVVDSTQANGEVALELLSVHKTQEVSSRDAPNTSTSYLAIVARIFGAVWREPLSLKHCCNEVDVDRRSRTCSPRVPRFDGLNRVRI